MALEDPTLPAEQVLRQGANMIRIYWQDTLQDLL
jgi:hypothetical protein